MKKYISGYSLSENGGHTRINIESHFEVIYSLGYAYIETVKKQPKKYSYKVGKNGRNYIIKFISKSNPVFKNIYIEFLNNIHHRFQRLVIPECIEYGNIGDAEFYVVLEWIDGKNFGKRWSSQYAGTEGGRKIKKYTIPLLLDLINDLLKIDTTNMINNNFRVITPGTGNRELSGLINKSCEQNIISEEDFNSAMNICHAFSEKIAHRPYMISNGDFQFLNFIEISEHKTALVDWDGARISCFEKEHCVALPWLLMWNNRKWQKRFLNKAVSELSIDRDIFRGVVLMLILRLIPRKEFGKGFHAAAAGYLLKVLKDDDFGLLMI